MHSHVFGEYGLGARPLGGRRTTATVIAAFPAKLLMAALMVFKQGSSCGSLERRRWRGSAGERRVVVIDATVLGAAAYSNREMRFFLLAWNAIALISCHGCVTRRLLRCLRA